MTRAIIYCRMSKNDKESDSLERQEAACWKYAEEHGYEVVAILKEKPGTSGAKFNAPELDNAIKAAKQELFDILIVRDVARFGRDRLKFELKELELNQYGVTVEYAWQEFADTPTGKLNKDLMVMFEEFKRSSITQHLVSGRRDKVELYKSFLVHGNPPFGYRVVKDSKIFRPAIDEFEAGIVKTIFNLYVIEGYSLGEIAKHLNESRIPCWSQLRPHSNFGGTKSRWYSSTVREILKNSAYKGDWQYGKNGIKETTKIANNEIVTVYEKKKNDEDYLLGLEIPAIVSVEIWQTAQERLSKNKNSKGRKPKYNYLVARQITCRCGAKMCGSRRTGHKRMYLYYHCPIHDARNGVACLQKNVRADKIDARAWQWLEDLLRDKDKLKKRIDAYLEDKEKELRPLLEEVGRLDEIISRRRKDYNKLIDLYLSSSDYGQNELLGRKLELEKKLQEDEQKRRELQTQLEQLGASLRALEVWQQHYQGYGVNGDSFAEFYAKCADEARAKGLINDNVDYWKLAKIARDKDDLTFEEKREYVEKFNLQVRLVSDTEIGVSCIFSQDVLLSLLDEKIYVPVEFMPFTLMFSDRLNFNELPQSWQVEAIA